MRLLGISDEELRFVGVWTGDWVRVPCLLERSTICINHAEEKGVEKPEVVRIGPIQAMESLETCEECSPLTAKVASYFYP